MTRRSASQRPEPFDASLHLGKRTEVTRALANARAEPAYSRLAFELFKESGILITVAACARPSSVPLPRDQAICAGLLVRISKFMIAVVQLVGTSKADRREVILALIRSIMESAVNCAFLITKDDPAMFDRYVQVSLAPERELYDVIQANIAARGGSILPIETRMLGAIQNLATQSDMHIQQVPPKHQEWGGTVRDKLREWMPTDAAAYAGIFRIPSHAIHGTWVDLLLHHIKPEDSGYVPKAAWSIVDARLLNPVATIALSATREYLAHFLPDTVDRQTILDRLSDLRERMSLVEEAHESWIQSRTTPST
jgi:hypothetical protein